MADITQLPYFNHDNTLIKLIDPIQSMADIRFFGFRRKFLDGRQFSINPSQRKEYWCEYWGDLYRYGVFEGKTRLIPSAFYMWDHLPFAPPEIYVYLDHKHGISHGLTIIEQCEEYTDSFIFETSPGNNQVNHFYLNQKELFKNYIKDFYGQMASALKDLEKHTFRLGDVKYIGIPTLTDRQASCAHLLLERKSAKEIGRGIGLSPRTVEAHLNVLKEKFRVDNREQLIDALRRFL